MDYNMPVVNGIEATKQIKILEAKYKSKNSIIIIGTSAL